MRRILTFLLAAVLAWPQSLPYGYTGHTTGGASWILRQTKYFDNHGNGTGGSGCTVGTTSCVITVTAIAAGSTLIVYSENFTSTGTLTLSSISEETSTDCASCQSLTAASFNLDIRYVTNATGSETTITCNFSTANSTYQGCGVVELTPPSGTVSLSSSNNSQPSCGTSCTGITLTPGSNDAILQTIFPSDNATAISAPYTAACIGASPGAGTCSGIGSATSINTSSGTAPTWTVQTASELVAMNAIDLTVSAGGGGITLISHTSKTTTTSGTTLTTSAINCTNANFIVVGIGFFSTLTQSISDSSSNSYTGRTQYASGSFGTQLFYVFNPTVTGSMTFTLTSGSADFTSIAVACFSGLVTSPFDAENGAVCCATSGNGYQPGSITPAGSGELFISVVADTSSTTDTIDSSFTVLEQQTFGGAATNTGLSFAYRVYNGTTALNPTWTVGTQDGTDNGDMTQAAFK